MRIAALKTLVTSAVAIAFAIAAPAAMARFELNPSPAPDGTSAQVQSLDRAQAQPQPALTPGLAPRPTAGGPAVVTPLRLATTSGGFDWGAAAVGAVAALGLLALAVGATTLVRRRTGAQGRVVARSH
jgi:hypothetical protein